MLTILQQLLLLKFIYLTFKKKKKNSIFGSGKMMLLMLIIFRIRLIVILGNVFNIRLFIFQILKRLKTFCKIIIKRTDNFF